MIDQAQEEPQAPVVPQETQQQAQERLYKESEVNRLIGVKKHDAYQKGHADGLAKAQAPMQAPGDAGANITPEQARQLVAEEIQRHQHEAKQQQDAVMIRNMQQEFINRIADCSSKYPDFNEVMKPLLENEHVPPPLMALALSVDNTGDVIYDMYKNRYKRGEIMNMVNNPNTHLDAISAIQRLSGSIKQNEQAKLQENAPEPLDQLKSSYTGTDNGSYTKSDMRSIIKRLKK